MKLEVRPCSSADLERAKSFYGPETGDFCSPLMDTVWPLDEKHSNAAARAEWSVQQQIDVFENDPTTRMAKVVDTDMNDDIIALGRWHYYADGFVDSAGLKRGGLKPTEDSPTYPEGLNGKFYRGILKTLIEARRGWMGDGPYWVLSAVQTRAPLRKNGAGSLILEWGLQQAAKDGVPAYLEAAPGAVSLYKKHGFREVGKVHLNAADFGLPGVEFDLLRMRADPKP